MKMSDADSVRVALRIRPLVKSEIEKGCQEIVNRIPGEAQVVVKNHDAYTFNYVFSKNESQQEVYVDAIQPMIKKLFEGYNVTILAYGQTGSGKTHTMGTAFNGEQNSEMGVIPRAMHDIFYKVSKMSESCDISLTCSFMELYQETLYDLLTNAPREQCAVDIREDSSKGIVIPGLTEIKVTTAEETTACLIRGSAGRAVGATAMNEQSSRSHAIFTVNVNIIMKDKPTSSTTAKFNLVDLAGSERSKKTKATGDRFKEGVNINKGLLALGNVISALGSGQSSFVSYRDSKLTRLLQDSLGGNSITLMIACISPADYNLEETISTLRYADRARKIRNKPIVNQDPHQAEITKLNNIIQNLRIQLLGRETVSLNNLSNIIESTDASSDYSHELIKLKKQNEELFDKNVQLRQQLQATLNDVTEIEMRASIAEETHDKLYLKFNEVRKLLNNNDNSNVDNKTDDELSNLNKIRNIVDEIENIFKENHEELMSQKSENSLSNDVTFSISMEDVQLREDQYTTKRLEINNEIRKLNRELALKEFHHQKVSTNLIKFCDYQGSTEKLIKESEMKIQTLEAERNDLLEKLRSVKENVSAKIAEERRKRLQHLEHEINEMRKKILQQDKLLKVKEKEAQKIINLNNEIQQMKAAKVNLLKAMKKEAETFRQWKLNREKQLTQLKEKDRKLQNEMTRMTVLHNKQKNVLKRKVEEAHAINKRLKDILEKQKHVQLKRNAVSNVQSSKIEQVTTLIDHELELILSVVDAQNTLEQIMEDRTSLNKRLKELQNEQSKENTEEILAIENDLLIRNSQIDELQQKILTSDILGKIKSICDGITSLPEAKHALKHLFNSLMDLRKEFAAKDNKIEEFKALCEIKEEKFTAQLQILEENQNRLREELSNSEKTYEEKICVLLRELNKSPQIANNNEENIDPDFSQRIQIQQEAFDKIETLREELEHYKSKYKEYENFIENNPKIKKIKLEMEVKNNVQIKIEKTESSEEITDFDELEDELSEEEIGEDSFGQDPDWKKTPQIRKKRSSQNKGKSLLIQAIDNTLPTAMKRSSNGQTKCRCKSKCSTKRCSCRNNGNPCSEKCGCIQILCQNKSNDVTENNSVELNKTQTISTSSSNATFITENKENSDINNSDKLEESIFSTPKKFKSDEEQINNLDITTPKYPFKNKKRIPFFQ